jgi:hypothetical protein
VVNGSAESTLLIPSRRSCISSSSAILLLVWKICDHTTYANNNFGMQTCNSSHVCNILKHTTTTDIRQYKNLSTYPLTCGPTYPRTHGLFNNAFSSVQHEMEATS